ncbi:Holin-like toxin [Macrococcoides canis]|uniref:Uncharacterized protein n=1 Tax=Macrococcoides canis TaxID=1855823 RepID=A0A1W7AE61_9STAP|nr:hypothetical protein [Macrococcus canis]ARQ07903.1 hypothetical protein MCCS_23230 [Macrococcus canis]UJS27592.1 hypothetical protein L2Z53_10725 [Macrococcus canis]
MDVLVTQLSLKETLFLQMFVGPDNALAASFIIMMCLAITMLVEKIKSDEK